jgi:hypothetical protein
LYNFANTSDVLPEDFKNPNEQMNLSTPLGNTQPIQPEIQSESQPEPIIEPTQVDAESVNPVPTSEDAKQADLPSEFPDTK